MANQRHGVPFDSNLVSQRFPLDAEASILPTQDASETSSASCDALRVVFCWAEISGYMADCFRELAGRQAVEPLFIAFASGRPGAGGAFSDSLVGDLPCRLLEPRQRNDVALVRSLAREHRADLIVLCGWFHPAYRQLLKSEELAGIPVVMTMDTPWWGRPRQWLGRFFLRRLLRRISLMVVTGERSWQYAIRLGIPQTSIQRGMYGVDWTGLSRCLTQRMSGSEQRLSGRDVGKKAGEASWPRSFLFAGRYAQEKALDVLVAGYKLYRERMLGEGDEPWPLVCCGTGPLKHLLQDIHGIEDRGFVQPQEMRHEMTSAGVFVLPSRYDPWPLALVEACAAGLPVIASEACGSTVELVRPEFNGYLIPTGNVVALAAAMVRAHQQHDRLQLYGQRANQFAAAYSAQVWADRWERMLMSVVSATVRAARSAEPLKLRAELAPNASEGRVSS